MDVLFLTLIVAGGLFWLHRRDRAAAWRAGYGAGYDAGVMAGGTRHGLAPLPIEKEVAGVSDHV